MTTALKVLIVEDEHVIALDLQQTLSSNGYNVIGIANASKTALNFLQGARPDVAVLDLNLGGDETSFEVAARLQEMDCPFVFVSGYSPASFELPENLAATPWISKPFRETQLLTQLREIA